MIHRNGEDVTRSVPITLVDTGSDPPDAHLKGMLKALRDEVAGGLLYSHGRSNANTSRMLEFATFLYALIEVLEEKGLFSIDELDARKDAVAVRVRERFLTKGMGVHMQEPERNKYSLDTGVEIDCESRIHLCKAACCRFWFPLSKQDVQEGIVQWDLRNPYIIDQDEDGYCRHLERGACHCTVYQHRPVPCRTFDCRRDSRIWLDFENRVVNPDLDKVFGEEQGAQRGTTP